MKVPKPVRNIIDRAKEKMNGKKKEIEIVKSNISPSADRTMETGRKLRLVIQDNMSSMGG